MRKLLITTLFIGAVSCTNPEDGASGTPVGNSGNSGGDQVTNSPPGVNSPDTAGGTRLDTSMKNSTRK